MATATKSTKAESTAKGAVVKRGNGSNYPEGSSVIKGETGQTIIHNQVVAKIIGLAVREIEGVHRLVPFGATQSVTSLAKSVTGGQMRDLGVRVEVGTREAAADIRIIADYGASIPAIAEAIRRNVSGRIEEMTGLKVVGLNIDVIDLYFSDGELDEEEEVEMEPRVR